MIKVHWVPLLASLFLVFFGFCVILGKTILTTDNAFFCGLVCGSALFGWILPWIGKNLKK